MGVNDEREGKTVWNLREHLRANADEVRETQALTLDKTRPYMGLSGVSGLFGTSEWWDSIASGRIPTVNRAGTITKLVFAGQDSRRGGEVNSFEMALDAGGVVLESIYTHRKEDRRLFKVGARVLTTYALDELKKQPAPEGGVNRLAILLEMRVEVASFS